MSLELKRLKKELTDIVSAAQVNTSYRAEKAVDDIWLLLGLAKETAFDGEAHLPPNKEHFKEDSERVRDALRDKGYKNIGTWEAYDLWKEFSLDYAATWLTVPNDNEEILNCLKPYIKREFYLE